MTAMGLRPRASAARMYSAIEHVDHAGAQRVGLRRRHGEPEDAPGHDQVSDTIPAEALAAAEGRQPAEPEGEHDDREDSGGEHGHREGDEGAADDELIGEAPLPERGNDAERHRNEHRQDQAADEDRQRDRQRLAEKLGHRLPGLEGDAEIALNRVLGPVPVLDRQRLIEVELPAELLLDLGGDRAAGGQHRHRIAGHHPEREEDQDRHGDHDRDERDEPLGAHDRYPPPRWSGPGGGTSRAERPPAGRLPTASHGPACCRRLPAPADTITTVAGPASGRLLGEGDIGVAVVHVDRRRRRARQPRRLEAHRLRERQA